MADYVSLNEFIDRTSAAKIGQHIDVLKAGLSRATARPRAAMSMMERAALVDEVKPADLEHEFEKMKSFVLKRYEKASSRHTFLDEGGNFVDCIEFEQQQSVITARAAGHDVLKEPPPPLMDEGKTLAADGALPMVESIAPPLGRGTTDPFGNARHCPDGAVALRRITLSQIARMGKFERFFQKFPGKEFPIPTNGALPASDTGPDGYVHRHAIVQAPFTGSDSYFGCTSFLNLWGEDPSPGEMHLSQTWIVGNDPSGASAFPDTVESGWQVGPAAWGTKLPVLFIFFNPDGYGTRSPQGQSRSGYGVNQFGEGFISFPNTKWVANGATGGFEDLSTPGGRQTGFYLQWQRDSSGNWILYCGSTKTTLEGVGYFPADLYARTFLGNSANLLQFGGEVASNTPPGTGPMGSGVSPSSPAISGFGTVAFQKEISVQTSIGQAMTRVPLTATGDSPSFYQSVADSSTDPSWGQFFFFGGSEGPL